MLALLAIIVAMIVIPRHAFHSSAGGSFNPNVLKHDVQELPEVTIINGGLSLDMFAR